MIIGIDLDNTLIDYRNAFWQTALETGILIENNREAVSKVGTPVPNKNEIKSYLLSCENGDYQWESLQGQVYGKYIHLAQIFPGAANFLLHCHRRSKKVYILSHKTEYGHHDKSNTPLREAALSFLEQNSLLSGDFGITSKDVFFFDTRKEKINKIVELNCSYFIDDLRVVFEEPGFPENTKKILFDIHSEQLREKIFNSWEKINDILFGDIEEADIASYVESGVNKRVKTVHMISGRGNSRIYKIKMNSGQEYAGKLYPDPTFDDRNRLEKETKACRFLHSNKIKSVPELIWFEKKLNFGLFEWINGKEINNITDDHINHAAEFVKSLEKLSKHTSRDDFKLASAACLSGQMIEEQIRNRYKTILKFTDLYFDLRSFLVNDFSHAFEKILCKSKKIWPGAFDTYLSDNYQLLSPSDFGFHNALLTKDGLKFLDFEYFGWDDPIKLICDFLLHPGMVLTNKHKTLWLNMMEEVFIEDSNFHLRLSASYCLYGLCWVLIMLNIFIKDSQEKRSITGLNKSYLEKKQIKQLDKSRKLVKHINQIQKYGLPYE